MVAEIDPRGNEPGATAADYTTTYVYDDADRLVLERTAEGAETTYTYDDLGRTETVTDPKGGIAIYEYDAAGNVETETVKLSATDPKPKVTSYVYDAVGRVRFKTDPAGNLTPGDPDDYETEYRYDPAGRLWKTIDPDGNVTEHRYDSAGNESTIKDPAGAETRFSYDALGRLTQREVPGSRAEDETGNVNALGSSVAEFPITAPKAGMINAALSWDPVPALSTSSASGALAESTKVERAIDAHGESILEGDLTWADGTKVAPQTFGPASLGAGGTANHAVPVTATDAPITGSLTWASTTKSISISDSVGAVPATKTHDLVVNTPGQIQATLSWNAAIPNPNLDLELLDPAGGVVDDSEALTGNSETVDYTIPAGGTTGTYKLKVSSLAAGTTSYSISGSHPYFSNLNLELVKPNGQVAASSTASGSTQPEAVSYTPPAGATGTYTFRVISADQGTPSYTLATTRPITATATVALRLKDPGDAVVWSNSSISKSLNAIYSAPAPGGAYKFEIENLSTDIDVPSYSLSMRATVVDSGQRSGSLAEGASTNENVQAEDEGTIRASATWTDGTKVQSQTFGPASLGAGGTANHTVSVTATDAPITGSLTWVSTTKSISISDSVGAVPATKTHDLVVNTPGTIQATLSWNAAIPNPNLDLELLDPNLNVVDESEALTGNSETVDYTIPAGGTTGTYKLKVISLAAGTTSYSISGSHPYFSNLNLELLKPNGQVAASSTASGSTQPEAVTYTPTVTGTYTFRVISQDQGTPSYTLATTRPITATATVRLRLFNPAGTQVGSTQGASNAVSLSYRAPDPGGQYRVELTNLSTDIEVPSYTLHWKVPEASRYGDLDLYLVNASGGVIAEPANHSLRPEVLTYPGAAEGTAYKLRVVARTYEAAFRIDYGLPTAQIETRTYDAAGRVASTSEGGTTLDLTYDRADRLKEAKLPSGTVLQSFDYDAAGRTKTLTDDSGTQSFAYDRAGRLDSRTQGGVTTTYSYDAAGNEELISRAGDPAFSFAHDAESRFEARTQDASQTTVSYTDKVFPTRLDHATGERDERTFDPLGQVTRLELKPQPTSSPDLALTQDYDVQGNLETVTDVTGAPVQAASYDYDELDRLRSETLRIDGQNVTYEYDYDAQGNRTIATGPGGTTTYAYNPAGQLVSSTDPAGKFTAYVYDDRGNLALKVAPEGTTVYAWTPEGRLASVTQPDSTVVSFTYDVEGRRTEKRVGNVTTAYAYENGRLVSLTTGANTVRFTYDETGAPLTISTGGVTYTYRTDDRGSVIQATN